jgi:GNAT superfamily N-acetyltransferase
VSQDGAHATVSRLATAAVFDEVVERAPAARVVWVATPGLDDALRARGCRDQDPPLTSYITALATDAPPPAVPGVEVRRVETYEQFLVALDVSARGWGEPPSDDPEEAWERRRRRPGGEWLAFVDGEPVAYAGAIAGDRGLFLTGGVTLAEARGRGAYRALVRERWDEAVRRGTPALVVHAEEPSRRILERIGFERAAAIVELVSDPAVDSGG